ncbi:MAG: hypothetical protein WC328_15785 [Kiritimatiellia bacterium]
MQVKPLAAYSHSWGVGSLKPEAEREHLLIGSEYFFMPVPALFMKQGANPFFSLLALHQSTATPNVTA